MTAIEKLEISLLGIISFDSEELRTKYKEAIKQAKEIEKQQQGYSDEEVKQAYTEGSFAQLRYIDGLPYIDRDRWFEQFKNK